MAETAIRRLPQVPAAAWLKALAPAVRLAFHGDARARAAVLPVWGVEFSEEACRANTRSSRATLWLGPDEYLLLDFGAGPDGQSTTPGGLTTGTSAAGTSAAAFVADSSSTIVATLEHALAEVPHALVDISHRQFALEVSGPHAATILSGACPLDLDLAEFPVGMCTRTVLTKADIVLWRTRPDAFHLEVWRSFAGYVTGILSEIAVEFYPAR